MFAPRTGSYLFAALAVLLLGVLLIVLFQLPLWGLVAFVGLIGLWCFFAWFFRDPERTPGEGIVSAADGRVRAVTEEEGRWRISVFMNVTDVHVNRFPLDGRVDRIEDGGTGFRPAYADDARHNVRRHYHLSTGVGPVEVVQLTGIVARRLVSFVHAGDSLSKGSRFGMIILGSRVDVLLPVDTTEPLVRPHQRVRAGLTTIARERR